MGPTERTVARTLTALLSASGHKGDGLLREYIRYKDLVLLPGVFKELAPAREALLGGLHAQLERVREAFEAKVVLPTSSGAQVSANYPMDLGELSYGSRRFLRAQTTGKNLPEVVAKIILAKQAEEKVREMSEVHSRPPSLYGSSIPPS